MRAFRLQRFAKWPSCQKSLLLQKRALGLASAMAAPSSSSERSLVSCPLLLLLEFNLTFPSFLSGSGCWM